MFILGSFFTFVQKNISNCAFPLHAVLPCNGIILSVIITIDFKRLNGVFRADLTKKQQQGKTAIIILDDVMDTNG